MNRKGLQLLLLILLLLALFYAWSIALRQPRVESSAGTTDQAARTARSSRESSSGSLKVRTDLLSVQKSPFPGVRSNLFGPLYETPPPPPPPPPVVAVPPPPPPPPPKIDVVRRELARFTFMGYLRKESSWTIFLQSGDEIFLVKEGDRFGRNREFHARSITPEKLVLTQADLTEPIEIPLVEQQPLIPSLLPTPAGSGFDGASLQPASGPAVGPSLLPAARPAMGRSDIRRPLGGGRAPFPPPPSGSADEPPPVQPVPGSSAEQSAEPSQPQEVSND